MRAVGFAGAGSPVDAMLLESRAFQASRLRDTQIPKEKNEK
jgi:hypothetical protein